VVYEADSLVRVRFLLTGILLSRGCFPNIKLEFVVQVSHILFLLFSVLFISLSLSLSLSVCVCMGICLLFLFSFYFIFMEDQVARIGDVLFCV